MRLSDAIKAVDDESNAQKQAETEANARARDRLRLLQEAVDTGIQVTAADRFELRKRSGNGLVVVAVKPDAELHLTAPGEDTIVLPHDHWAALKCIARAVASLRHNPWS